MGFFVGLLVLGAAVWLLSRLKARDLDDCAAVLGLARGEARSDRGTTPEGFGYSQRPVLKGTLAGHPATLWSRVVRHPNAPRRRRNGSEYSVLELTLPRAVRTSLRLQPAGMLGALESWVQGPPTDRVSIDPAFDEAYAVHASSADEARAILSPSVRSQVLDFRRRIAGDLPPSVAGQLTSGLLLGTFHLEGTTARYALFGSPTRAVAEHLKSAGPVLLALAAAAGADRG